MKTAAQTGRRSKLSSRQAAQADAGAWRTLRAGGLQVLQAKALGKLGWLGHGFSTRPGGESKLDGPAPSARRGGLGRGGTGSASAAGVLNLGHTHWDARSRVLANRRSFLAALGAEDMELVTLRQIHSDVIHPLTEHPPHSPSGDAAITRTPGLLLAVQTADCVPILLADTQRRAVAAVHAGWRGTLRRIVAKTLGRMQMIFGTRPEDVVAALGPGIGRCCYEVGPEVAQAFAGQFAAARQWFDGPFDPLAAGEEATPLKWLTLAPPGHHPPPPRLRLDLVEANRWQLADAGVAPADIVSSRLCTACRTDLLFSHRRERGRTGRMMGVIGLRRPS